MGTRVRTLAAAAALALVSGPKAVAADEPFTEEVARRLLPEAAELDNAPAWNVMRALGATVTLADLRVAQAFSLPYVAGILSGLRTPEADRDFHFDPSKTPDDYAAALNGGKPLGLATSTKGISLLRPEYLKRVVVKQTGNRASGEVDFEAPGVYRGHLVFEAMLAAGAWYVTAFEFPATKARIRWSKGGWREVRMPVATPPVRLPVVSAPVASPDPSKSIVVGVSAEHVWVNGAEVRSVAGLRQAIVGRASTFLRDSTGGSTADALIFGDEDAPWTAIQWVMQAFADEPAKVFRIHFAATHRASGETGAIPTFLPRDDPPSPPNIVDLPKLTLIARDQGTPSTPEAVFAELKRLAASSPTGAVVEIGAPPPFGSRIRFGFVLRVVDAARQAGFSNVQFVGPAMPPSDRARASDHDLADALAVLAKKPRGVPIVKIGGRELGEAKGVSIPDGLAPSLLEKASARASSAGATSPPGEDLPVEETEQVHERDVMAREPTIKDAELSDHNETDSDLPTEETLVEEKPLAGPGGLGGGGGTGPLAALRQAKRDTATQAAIDAALRWLAAHQSADGGWEAAGFHRWCDRKLMPTPAEAGPGKPSYDVGVTGLALLAFLGAGYTNRSDGPFGRVVANGLRYLRNVQDAEGCIGPKTSSHFVYNHAIATLAFVEAYGLTQSTVYKGPAQKGLGFLARARNPFFAWRYGVKPGDNDTSITAWAIAGLASARLSNENDARGGRPPALPVDDDAFEGAKAWIEKVTDPDFGRVGYQIRGTSSARPTELVDRFPADRTEAMTAAGILVRMWCSEDPRQAPSMRRGLSLIEKLPPTWDESGGSIDMDYWYFGSLVMFQAGGAAADAWRDAMTAVAVKNQRRDGEACGLAGSWDPKDVWGPDGGRVYATAMMAMCLEAPALYPRRFEAPGGK